MKSTEYEIVLLPEVALSSAAFRRLSLGPIRCRITAIAITASRSRRPVRLLQVRRAIASALLGLSGGSVLALGIDAAALAAQSFGNIRLMAVVRWLVVVGASELVGEVVLLDPSMRIVVGIAVADAVSDALSTFVVSVAEVWRYRASGLGADVV